jgi:hypothetical protein
MSTATLKIEYFLLLAKEEMVLQGLTDRVTEIARCYGMEINVEKTKVMKISRQLSPVHITIDQRQLENVDYFNCLGSTIT